MDEEEEIEEIEVRKQTKVEIIKRGCEWCTDRKRARSTDGVVRYGCIHSKCPYTILDKYETYDEFLDSDDSRIITPEFFRTSADCYELAQVRDNPYHLYFEGVSRRF
jgi:hypothetical protein